MSFMADYRAAKVNVRTAFEMEPMEATRWLIIHVGIKVVGSGIYTRVTAKPKAAELIRQLAGPHGQTVAWVLKARNHS